MGFGETRIPTQSVWVDGPIPRVPSSTSLFASLLQHSNMLWKKNLVLLVLGNTRGQMEERKHVERRVALHPFVVGWHHAHVGPKSHWGIDWRSARQGISKLVFQWGNARDLESRAWEVASWREGSGMDLQRSPAHLTSEGCNCLLSSHQPTFLERPACSFYYYCPPSPWFLHQD